MDSSGRALVRDTYTKSLNWLRWESLYRHGKCHTKPEAGWSTGSLQEAAR